MFALPEVLISIPSAFSNLLPQDRRSFGSRFRDLTRLVERFLELFAAGEGRDGGDLSDGPGQLCLIRVEEVRVVRRQADRRDREEQR
jgi:hypothetical protein